MSSSSSTIFRSIWTLALANYNPHEFTLLSHLLPNKISTNKSQKVKPKWQCSSSHPVFLWPQLWPLWQEVSSECRVHPKTEMTFLGLLACSMFIEMFANIWIILITITRRQNGHLRVWALHHVVLTCDQSVKKHFVFNICLHCHWSHYVSIHSILKGFLELQKGNSQFLLSMGAEGNILPKFLNASFKWGYT